MLTNILGSNWRPSELATLPHLLLTAAALVVESVAPPATEHPLEVNTNRLVSRVPLQLYPVAYPTEAARIVQLHRVHGATAART